MANDVNVTATPAEPTATPSAPAAAPATPTAPTTPVAATPATPQAPATSGAPEGWVPSYRIRESREAAVREANAEFARREAEYQTQLGRYQAQLQALTGVQPPQNPEVAAVRGQFSQLYPGLSRLEDQAEQLQALLERAEDLESASTHHWQNYGRQSMDRLFDHAEKSVGTPLTDEGKRALHAAFVGFVQSSPELTARYAQDPTLVDEYWKALSSSLIDPVRRTAATTVAGRAAGAIPQDTPGGAPRATPVPQPANLDERAASAWALYQQTAKT